MKWLDGFGMNLASVGCVIALFTLNPVAIKAQDGRPIADAGSSRYAGLDPVVLDGTRSYDPDNSGMLSYTWRQTSGPSVVIIDGNTATPTIAGSIKPNPGRDPTPKPQGFSQTDDIQECEFELLVSDGKWTGLPDTVKIIIVPDFGTRSLEQENPPFDRDKPTVITFSGGDCVTGHSGNRWNSSAWNSRANVIIFPNGYWPDSDARPPTYYKFGDMIIVYLSSVAADYKQPIQAIGFSTGGMPAIDVGIHLNRVYRDPRYAVNRVTQLDAGCRWNQSEDFAWRSYDLFLTSAVDQEQCWIDEYYGGYYSGEPYRYFTWPDELVVTLGALGHGAVLNWYKNSLTGNDMNTFNNGLVAGAYWSVIGPGKNLELGPTDAYYFRWDADEQSGHMSLLNEALHPGRLPEPVTLVGPDDGAIVDASGAVFTCQESENAVDYQLLFGPDPHHVKDYYVISDTSSPPTEVITSSPFEQTWWTVRVRDLYGSTIYADPVRVHFEVHPLIENITTGKGYSSLRHAINDAQNGQEIVIQPGIYHQENISFQGKHLTLRSIDPNDTAIVASTVIKGVSYETVVTFSNQEDTSCVLAGCTITGGKRGIYCSGSSPTMTHCIVMKNGIVDIGAGMYLTDGSNPTLINCMFSENSSSMTGGGIQSVSSNPILMNCTLSNNSATYFGGGIYCAGGNPVLTNCILWYDTPEEICTFGSTPIVTFSDVQGGWPGEGNLDADPLFADSDNGDYHLMSQAGRCDFNHQNWVIDDITSPCIDAGDPTIPIGLEPSPNGNRINIGAYGGTSEASKSP